MFNKKKKEYNEKEKEMNRRGKKTQKKFTLEVQQSGNEENVQVGRTRISLQLDRM